MGRPKIKHAFINLKIIRRTTSRSPEEALMHGQGKAMPSFILITHPRQCTALWRNLPREGQSRSTSRPQTSKHSSTSNMSIVDRQLLQSGLIENIWPCNRGKHEHSFLPMSDTSLCIYAMYKNGMTAVMQVSMPEPQYWVKGLNISSPVTSRILQGIGPRRKPQCEAQVGIRVETQVYLREGQFHTSCDDKTST